MDVSRLGAYNPYATAAKMADKRENIQGNKTSLQVNTDNNETGVVLSISKEGRARQQSRLPDLTVDDSILNGMNIAERKTAIAGYEPMPRNDFVEFTDPSLKVDISNIPASSPQAAYYRALLSANPASEGGNFEAGLTDMLGAKAAKYMELRKGIEEQYSSDELSEHIKWLDDSYDKAINNMADVEAMLVRGRAKTYEFFANANNDLVKHGLESGSIVEYDKEAFSKSVDSLVKNMTDTLKHYGALAKQYMLDGNAAPVAKEDKNNFVAYLAQNTDSSKGVYSPDDLDTIKTIFSPNYSNTTDALYTALEKLQDSGLSNGVRAAAIRIATHNGGVPEGFEKREQALYESMLKWQQTS